MGPYGLSHPGLVKGQTPTRPEPIAPRPPNVLRPRGGILYASEQLRSTDPTAAANGPRGVDRRTADENLAGRGQACRQRGPDRIVVPFIDPSAGVDLQVEPGRGRGPMHVAGETIGVKAVDLVLTGWRGLGQQAPWKPSQPRTKSQATDVPSQYVSG